MQQMTDEISKIKDTSVKNEEILTKIEKADKDSISKKGVWIVIFPIFQIVTKLIFAHTTRYPQPVPQPGPQVLVSGPKPHIKKTDEISNADLFLKLKSSINNKLQIELESVVNKVTDLVGSNVDRKPLVDVKPNVENLNFQIDSKRNQEKIIEDLG